MSDKNSRLILRAGLDKIVEGVDIRGSVADCVAVLRNSSALTDSTLRQMRGRDREGFLKEQARYLEIEKVGHYILSRKKRKGVLRIQYTSLDAGVEFVFVRNKVDSSKSILDLVQSGEEFSEDEIIIASTNHFQDSFLGREGKTNTEAVLGNNARDLSEYNLLEVNVLRTVPYKIFRLNLPFTKAERKTVYLSNEQ